MSLNIQPIKSQPSFGRKVPTVDALEVIAGKSLTSRPGGHRLDGFSLVCGALSNGHDIKAPFNTINDACRYALYQQVPGLGKIQQQAAEFFRNPKTPKQIDIWVARQVKKLGGKELDIKPDAAVSSFPVVTKQEHAEMLSFYNNLEKEARNSGLVFYV